MRWEEMDDIVEEQFDRIREIRRTKGRDYAGDGDTLGNFKRTAEEAGISPIQVWYVFAKKHWDAVATFARKGQVESEPIDGRIDDAITYLLLLKGLVAEDRAEADAMPNPFLDEESEPAPLHDVRCYPDGTREVIWPRLSNRDLVEPNPARVVAHSTETPGVKAIPVRRVDHGDAE